ncbi:MAG: hypothetical protein ABJC05_03180 [Pyrinomonadaceae bacterium]
MSGSFRVALLLAVHSLALLSLACPRGGSGQPEMRRIGPDVPASLVMYFKKDVTNAQISAFDKEVLSRPHPEGRGDYQAPGVQSTLLVSTQGHQGYAITFFPNATDQQRQSLRNAMKASPLVYKVFENVTPADVKTLD